MQSVQCAGEEQEEGGGGGKDCVSTLPSPDPASLPSAQELHEDYEDDQRLLSRIRRGLHRDWSLQPLLSPALFARPGPPGDMIEETTRVFLNHVPRVVHCACMRARVLACLRECMSPGVGAGIYLNPSQHPPRHLFNDFVRTG